MFEALLGSKFSKKCKYCVKCINSRVQLIRKKRQATVRFLKKDVADLLANGHELNAFGRIEALIVEINHTSCYDMIEQYCQYILNQLPSVQKQRQCPEEGMEAVSTLIFAAARFSDLPELYNLRRVFTERYGSYMESSVNAEFVEKVQKKSFSMDKKLRLMQNIAEEFSVRWDSRAFRQKLSNPSAPPSDQPKRSISNIEGHSHAEMSGKNAAVNPQKEAIFDTAVEVNGRNRATLNEVSSANRNNGPVFNANVAVNGRREAVINHVAAVNGRAGADLSAGGLVNGRKEAVINSIAAVNGRDGAVLNAGGSFNGRKEVVLNGDITVNGRRETVTNSAMPFNRRNDAVSGAGEDQEVASKERREPPSWTFVQKQLVQPEPRDIHVIPVVRSGRSHNPAETIKKVPAAAKETENVEPVYDNAGARLYVKPKESQKGIQKDDWFKPKVSQNVIHKHDGLNEGTARSRSLIAQDGPDLIGLEKQSVAPAISRDVKAVNMIPLSTKLKESRNDAAERVLVYNASSDPTVQERRPTVPVNFKDARPFNMIPPPYTKPRLRNPSTLADDTKLSDVPIKSSRTADHERSDDGNNAKPVSVRRRLPKPTLVTESDNATNDAKPNGRQADDDLYAEKNLDGNQRKVAAEEMNGAVNDERHAHGTRKHGGRRSTVTYDGDRDEEEAAMDRLLLHFSKKGMSNDPSRRRARLRASPELVVDTGRVRDHHDDLPLPLPHPHPHHQANGRIHLKTTESVRYRPARVASLLSEPTTPVVEAGVSKGPARATSMQPDLLSPGGARLHPRLPDYDEFAAGLIALKNA